MASCPPSGAPIAHGRAGVARPGLERVVPPLAERGPDRVHGRQVDDVEPHVGDRLEPAGGGAQRARDRLPAAHRVELRRPRSAGRTRTRTRTGRAAAPRAPACQPDLVTRSRSGYSARIGRDPRRLRRRQPVPGRQAAVAQLPGERVERRARRRGPGGARRLPDRPRGPLEEQRPLGQHELDVLAARDLDARVVLPVRDRIGPRLDVEMPGALAGNGDVAAVPVAFRARARASGPAGRSGPPGSRSTTPAPSTPWPSLMTVALTWKVSPATALAGRRPHSTTGSTSRMGMRPITRSPYLVTIRKGTPTRS